MLDYLLEIGCEELPAAFITKAAEYLKTEAKSRLDAAHLPYGDVTTGGTPRRLYLSIANLAERQTDKSEIVMGPPAAIAFEKNGNISSVGKKFAESKGLDMTSIKKVSTPKGEYLQGDKKTGGGEAASLLLAIIPDMIKNIPFAKSMKWGTKEFKFARPVHYFLSILSGNHLPFEIEGVKSGNVTFGHRFLAPSAITVKSFDEYKSSLEKAFVIIDSATREHMITEQIAVFAKNKSACIGEEKDLLATVANLVEYPHAVMGSFDDEFLKLPEEVLVTSMKINQKYFPVKDKNGKLLNMFVGVANIVPMTGDGEIRKGYERVLRARLNDAVFFFANDKKTPMEAMSEKLKNVVYQAKLGSLYDKTERMKKLSVCLAEKFVSESVESIKETASLAKADLMSEMVYEFPELQGIMGYYYAKIQGKSESIAIGIKEHYLPKFAGDSLPTTDEGAIVSIADKLDTLCACFAAGMIPSGNLDPYALRRAVIGVIAIIENGGLRLNLKETIDFALNNLADKLTFDKKETAEKILIFIIQRLKQIVITRGDADGEIFDAVVADSFDPIAIANLAKVIASAKNSEDFRIIAESFKRINNILKKNEWGRGDYLPNLFETEEEKNIATLIEKQNIASLIAEEKNYEALDELLKFAPPVNIFFANVMVMTENNSVRENRLCLLFSLRRVFTSVGNFDGISA